MKSTGAKKRTFHEDGRFFSYKVPTMGLRSRSRFCGVCSLYNLRAFLKKSNTKLQMQNQVQYLRKGLWKWGALTFQFQHHVILALMRSKSKRKGSEAKGNGQIQRKGRTERWRVLLRLKRSKQGTRQWKDRKHLRGEATAGSKNRFRAGSGLESLGCQEMKLGFYNMS